MTVEESSDDDDKKDDDKKDDSDKSDDKKDDSSHGSSGSRSSSSSIIASAGRWIRDSKGWTYLYNNGSKAAGTETIGTNGEKTEHISWVKIDDKWWVFGADAYLKTGWIKDSDTQSWYYVNEDRGMLTGWYYDINDSRWYYLDPQSGAMLTGWHTINGKSYYFTPVSTGATWVLDGTSGKWSFDKNVLVKPMGSLYMNETTPDGYSVDAEGARK